MQMQLAFVFPGQGSQSAGMLADLAAAHPEVEQTFAEASAGAGVDLWAIAQNDDAEALNRTENTQPALLAASVAVWRVWNKLGGAQPLRMAGHSLGEYSALVCAGALSLHDAAALVAERGRLMQAAVPAGVGAMAAVLGGDDAAIAEVCREVAGDEVVAPANYNSPGQVVIAGHAAAVDRALEKLAGMGVRKTVKLAVSVPSHTALMREAADGPSRYYVRTSVWTGGALDTTFVAVAQLAQESHAAARRAMQRAREQWLELILEEVGEEATAHAILLLGDGLYYDAALTGDPTRSGEGAQAAGPGRLSPEQLLPIVDRLLHAARGRAGGVSGR